MTADMLIRFLAGALTMAYLVAAAFFGRFWRKTGDGLFLNYSVAFLLLALNCALAALVNLTAETNTYIDILRVMAFLFILYGIIRKNLRAAPTK